MEPLCFWKTACCGTWFGTGHYVREIRGKMGSERESVESLWLNYISGFQVRSLASQESAVNPLQTAQPFHKIRCFRVRHAFALLGH